MLGEIAENVPLLQLLSTEQPVVFPNEIFTLGERYDTGTCLDLCSLVKLLSFVPDAMLLVRQGSISLNKLAATTPCAVE